MPTAKDDDALEGDNKDPADGAGDDEGTGDDDAGAGGDEGDEGDEGAGDDDSGTDDQGGDDADDSGGAPSGGSRRDKRIAALRQRAREAEERAIRAEAERDAGRKPAANSDDHRRIRDEKLALMDPAEKREFLRDEEISTLKQGQLLVTLQIQDARDEGAYDAKAAIDPIYAKHKGAVEKALAELRSRGTTAKREDLLAWVIGRSALTKSNKPDKKRVEQKRDAAERVNASRGKPLSGRSDAGSGAGNLKSLEDRLANVAI